MNDVEIKITRQIEECYSCGYKTYCNLSEAKAHRPSLCTEDAWFCDLCGNTYTANAYWWPDQYPNRKAMMTTCYVGNKILGAIRNNEKNT